MARTPRCCSRRRISPPRSVRSGSPRCAATSSISGTRWRREAGVCVPAAPDRASACRAGGVCGCTSRALQRGVAGTPGWVVAQQDPHPLRRSVGAAKRYPVGAAGSGGVVVLVAAGHAAPVEQVVRRVFPPGEGGPAGGLPTVQGQGPVRQCGMAQDGDGARWLPESRRVYLQGVGQVKVHLHRQVAGRVKTIGIKRQGRHWMLVLSCEDVPPTRCR